MNVFLFHLKIFYAFSIYIYVLHRWLSSQISCYRESMFESDRRSRLRQVLLSVA